MTRNHARQRWFLFEKLEVRRNLLLFDVMQFDQRNHELWRALKNCPETLANRYNRLCRVAAMYRVAGWL